MGDQLRKPAPTSAEKPPAVVCGSCGGPGGGVHVESECAELRRIREALPERVTCFSLHQPYAGLVAAGLKDETRLFQWPEKARPYPAPLLICSTAIADGDAWHHLAPRIYACTSPDNTDLWEHGVALTLVDVVGCRPLVEADQPRSWFWDPEGDKGRTRYLWMIANVRRVQPFPVKGRQGFAMSVSREMVEKALAAWRS